jgi:hypothetical protein
MILQPYQVAPLGMLVNFTEELHRLGFVARLAGIIDRDDQFNLNGHNVSFGLDKPSAFETFAGDAHG